MTEETADEAIEIARAIFDCLLEERAELERRLSKVEGSIRFLRKLYEFSEDEGEKVRHWLEC